MKKYYTITENKVPIGFFQFREDRDKAFDLYIMKQGRYGMKGEMGI